MKENKNDIIITMISMFKVIEEKVQYIAKKNNFNR